MDAVPIAKKIVMFGSKKIYLPKFTVALVRTPQLSPYHARFLVPLDFSKYDLRDYLFHAYNVRCFDIRSYVKQMPVRDTREQPRHFFRPESKKYMTVEMEQPFVWPETPSLEPWGKAERQREIEDTVAASGSQDADRQRDAAQRLRKQVEDLFKKSEPATTEINPYKEDMSPAEEKDRLKLLKRRRKVERMSPLQFWEDKRSEKVVQSDDRRKFAIKA